MSHVLITGMSGVGKTTALSELARRGYRTIDTDYGGWVLPDGTWDERRMTALLASVEPVIVSGTVENQGRFYDRFAAVVVLTLPIDILLERLDARTNNPYGKSAAEREEVIRYVHEVEPGLRATSTIELDGRMAVADIADRVERLVSESSGIDVLGAGASPSTTPTTSADKSS